MVSAEYGNPDGQPIFYFHGLPGSRLEAGHLHVVAVTIFGLLVWIDQVWDYLLLNQNEVFCHG